MIRSLPLHFDNPHPMLLRPLSGTLKSSLAVPVAAIAAVVSAAAGMQTENLLQ